MSNHSWFSRLGLGLLAAADGGYGSDDAPPEEPIPACCVLALPDTECQYQGDKSNYACPSGFYRQWWFCCEGTRQAACGECTESSSTCWAGPFQCSIWWWTGQSC